MSEGERQLVIVSSRSQAGASQRETMVATAGESSNLCGYRHRARPGGLAAFALIDNTGADTTGVVQKAVEPPG